MSNIFCLTDEEGKLLPPAVQGTVLAKYSRSPLSAREIVRTLTAEEADKFQDKWVVQFSHNSVAELANVPICFEGVSIIASKAIESFQRAGYSEKSTRYQEFSAKSFVMPKTDAATQAKLEKLAAGLYQAYENLLEPTYRICAVAMDKDPDDPKTRADRTVKARAFDNVRYLLPAGTGTNLAAVMNMLDVRRLITTLRGNPNQEFQNIGDRVHDAVMEMAPTLVKHTEPDTFKLVPKSLGRLPSTFLSGNRSPYVVLLSPHPRFDEYVTTKFKSDVADIYEMGWSDFSAHMANRPAYSEVPDVFKTVHLSFDVIMDYGAYRDLQRHRRCEQYSEMLGTSHGYVVPDDLIDTELEAVYRHAMNEIQIQEDILDPELIQYITPLGFLHRTRYDMDLAQAYYIAELRTKPQGHISYRRIAYSMYEALRARWPELLQWCRAIEPKTIGAHT